MRTGYWTCLGAAGLILVAGTAWGQRRGGDSAEQNVRQSQQYESLVCSNPSFRAKRIQQECGPITDPQLRQNCLASFAQYEPNMGSRGRTMASRTRSNRSTGTGYSQQDGMTGSSTGSMSTTTTYGSSEPAWGNNHTTPTNAYGASRNLPGEYSSGMVQAPGAMPNYPGPRPSGPMSGGGGGGGGGR